jgi:pyruvate/2-oxoglutarate dehydrogenase complex dihydrolipoamide acyltransferase (E2) component
MATPLILIAFAVENGDPTMIKLTVKGPSSKIPKDIKSEAGPKGTRVITLADTRHDALYSVGAVLGVNDVKVGDDDGEYLAWFKNFVPAANGGTMAEGADKEAEPEASPPPASESTGDAPSAKPAKGGKGKKAKATEPAPAPVKSRKDELTEMPFADLKKLAGKLGVKFVAVKRAMIEKGIIKAEAKVDDGGAKPEGKKAKATAPKGKSKATTYDKSKRDDFGPEFAPGKEVRVSYNHREFGVCEYGVTRTKDGEFKLSHFKGARPGIKKGMSWAHAWDMLEALVGRPKHNVPMRRWFRLP